MSDLQVRVDEFFADANAKGHDPKKLRRRIESELRGLYYNDEPKFKRVTYQLFQVLKINLKDKSGHTDD